MSEPAGNDFRSADAGVSRLLEVLRHELRVNTRQREADFAGIVDRLSTLHGGEPALRQLLAAALVRLSRTTAATQVTVLGDNHGTIDVHHGRFDL
ncbi:hypothetical protein [Nocardia wallacei]|uniref:hypothetical protein n=1 Tax=Nocardia wallacei TaxID=480035 RepID=UPI002455F08B|nr:hypothetical protein [Nocardia wallacei]